MFSVPTSAYHQRRGSSQGTTYLCDAIAVIVIGTALAAMIGWMTGSRSLVQVFPGYPPLYPGSALGLASVAAGLWGLAHRERRWVLTGAVVAALLGGLALVEYSAGIDLGIDRLLFVKGVVTSAGRDRFAGRMVMSTAVSFLLTAAALVVALAQTPWLRRAASAFTAAVVGAFALVTFVCYAGGVLDEFRFDVLAGMSLHVSLGLGLVAAGLVAIAWEDETAGSVSALPYWAPWAVGLASLTITLFVWRALVAQHERQLTVETRSQAFVARHDLERATDGLVTTLRVLPGSALNDLDSTQAWPATLRRLLDEVPGMMAALRADRSLNVHVPGKTSASDSTLSRALRAALRARETPSGRLTRDSVLIGVAPTTDRQRLFTLAVPVCGGGECTGYIVALLNAQRFLANALHGATPGYHLVVSTRGEQLFRPADLTQTGLSVAQVVSVDLGSLHLDIEVWPTDERLAVVHPELPDVVAALGLLLSGLLVLTFWLVRRSLLQTRLEQRARLSLALETATDGVWEWDVRGNTGTISDALWRRLGYASAELALVNSLRQWRALIHPDDARRVQQALERHVAGESASFEVEYRIKAQDGDWHSIVERGRVAERDIRGRPLIVLGIAADVTERKRADEALAANERRFRAMFDSAFQYQCVLDLEGACLEANHAVLEFAGTTMGAVRGRKLWETPWWQGTTDEQRERLRRACAEAVQGRTVRFEIEWAGAAAPALVDFSVKPILDGEGRVSQLLAEGRDVTDRLRAENAMREMESLSSMGRLAARVAHEVNNPLAGIQNSFLLIKDAIPESHPYHSYVGAIEREIGRISAVTRQLYETYRPDPDGRRESSVQTILSDAATLLGQVNRGAKVNVEVDTVGVPSKLPVPGALLRQAAYNLVQNAIDASPPGGVVKVVAKADDSVFSLSVCDQGPGVPDHLREQIFAPFFSTKRGARTSGMGLGLALVRRSVDALGGRIDLRDRPSGGTEFRIQIPLPSDEESS
jgi:PAS domain S-box-containing protein